MIKDLLDYNVLIRIQPTEVCLFRNTLTSKWAARIAHWSSIQVVSIHTFMLLSRVYLH